MVSNTQRTRPPKHLCQCYSTHTFTANCHRISPSAFIDVQSPQMFCRKSIHIFPENIIFLKNFSQTVLEISVIDFPISIHGYVNSREYTSPMARFFFFSFCWKMMFHHQCMLWKHVCYPPKSIHWSIQALKRCRTYRLSPQDGAPKILVAFSCHFFLVAEFYGLW